MKDKNIEKLIKRYESGHSSINDEQYLINHFDKSNHDMHSWFDFIKRNKTQTPENFSEDLWEKFEDKTQSNRKLIIGVLTAAASVILFLTIYLGNDKSTILSYEEKVALLNQVKEMVSEKEQDIATQDILYEDQNIIIYTKTEKN